MPNVGFHRIAMQLAATQENELINIGAGEEFSIRTFAELICHEVGYDFDQIQFDTSRYVGARSKCLGIGKLQRILPDLEFIALASGLKKTIAWFMDQGKDILKK